MRILRWLLCLVAVACVVPSAAAAATTATAAAVVTATNQIATAEANGQAAINALENSAQPNTPLATAIKNRYLNDYMLRAAMAANARQYTVSQGDMPGLTAPPISTTASAAAKRSPVPKAHAASCNGPVSNTRYWQDWPTGINLAWIAVKIDGWCFNGSYITSVNGWEFNKWTGTGYCIFNESTNHHGFGASDGAGHTAWMEGGHWAQVGPNIFITCGVSGSSGAATKRAAGNGYSDNSWT
jgi:hypothetical protein